MNESACVVVVGTGTAGLTAAFDLAKRGARVMLSEYNIPGRGLMGRATGTCYGVCAEDIDAAVAGSAMDRFRSLSGEGGFTFHEAPYVFLACEDDDAVVAALKESVE